MCIAHTDYVIYFAFISPKAAYLPVVSGIMGMELLVILSSSAFNFGNSLCVLVFLLNL